MAIILTGIYIYPIKSLAGISLNKSKVEEEGLQFDRRWMLVDENGKFLSQRTMGKMAQLQPEITPQGLQVAHRIGGEKLFIPLQAEGAPRQVTVWENTFEAQEVNEECNQWFTKKLGINCALVQLSPDRNRIAPEKYTGEDEVAVSFADGFPILLSNEASLKDLSDKSNTALEMERFRPNLVISGAEAWAENSWETIQINGITFKGVKPCGRCKVTTLNPKTGEPTGKEPLKTLSKLRNWKNNAIFGENLYPIEEGEIKIGYAVSIQNTKDNPVKTIS
ncbi:MOSC domain-containing protein [Persicobacter diffluens]|uniref:MOSC domain-containing protein n=1 Tax=Persicobacter diffluens TaxID=981 RepID=A0AAN4VVX5_9BACT|nr:MOSC domain-containing protein [Persicobacter diffluens]